MQVISSPQLIFEILNSARRDGEKIGLVPTMGALHAGHSSLVNACIQQNTITVVSIFVNPLQFNNQEDLDNYPRTFDQDQAFLEKLGVDIVYSPPVEEMYPEKPIVRLNFGTMAKVLEGEHRPNHFEGVGLVVNKLLNQVLPNKAYFGLKDLQQYLVVKRLVKDFSINTEIIGLPIVREKSGLAMSSRNTRLSENGKKQASQIYAGLKYAEELLASAKTINETKDIILNFYNQSEGFNLEYLEFVNPDDLTTYEGSRRPNELAICIAGHVEGIRLIDNLYLRQD